MMTLEELDFLIDKAEADAEATDLRNYYKETTNNAARREQHRLETLRLFLLIDGVAVAESNSGLILVNGKFEYALLTGRWRVVGGNKWYWSKRPESFISKYVLKENKDD